MLIGYARVSTIEQSLDLQINALETAGCQKIFTDEISGSKAERPGLTEALSFIRPGDTLVVWKLDRLGRSLSNLISWVVDFEKKGIEFQSLHESLDTNTAAGKLLFHIAGAFAEYERNIIIERTRAGLAAAAKRGQKMGRPASLTDRQVKTLKTLYDQKVPLKEIEATLKISRPTVYKYLRKGTGVPEGP